MFSKLKNRICPCCWQKLPSKPPSIKYIIEAILKFKGGPISFVSLKIENPNISECRLKKAVLNAKNLGWIIVEEINEYSERGRVEIKSTQFTLTPKGLRDLSESGFDTSPIVQRLKRKAMQ